MLSTITLILKYLTQKYYGAFVIPIMQKLYFTVLYLIGKMGVLIIPSLIPGEGTRKNQPMNPHIGRTTNQYFCLSLSLE